MPQQKVYLDDNGNPVQQSSGRVYLDDSGNPITEAQRSRGAAGSWDDRPAMSSARLALDTADALRMGTVEKTADILRGTATAIPELMTPRGVINAVRGAPGTVEQALVAVRNAGAVIPKALQHIFEGTPSATPEQAQTQMVGGTTDFVTEVAPMIAGAGQAARAGLGAARNALPSTARAGANFNKVMDAARDVPLNTSAAEAAVARAQELRARGSSMPKVLNDFAKDQKARTGDFHGTPVTQPMTYETGRDFASNAGALSTREITALNAKMQAQVAEFAKAMKTANREAAAKVGMADLYDSAMKEYARAANLAEKKGVLTKYLIRWGGPAVLGAGLLKLYKDFTD